MFRHQTQKSDTAAESADEAGETDRIRLFGLEFDALRFCDAVDRMMMLARQPNASYVVTANVDHVVRANRTPELRPIYEQADLVLADGMPVVWASRLCGRPLPERVAGSDLMPALCKKAAEHGYSVFLLGGAGDSAARAADVMKRDNPDLNVAGTYCPPMGFENDAAELERTIRTVRDARPDILFVALGSPKQELWIQAHRDECQARLSIGVGITFSFICGDVVRAPMWMRRWSLEWVHRLAQEPSRLWKRYLVHDLHFVPLVIREWWASLTHGARRQSLR